MKNKFIRASRSTAVDYINDLELALRQKTSQARYFNLFDKAPAGYLNLSENRTISESNQAAAALFAVLRESLLMQPCRSDDIVARIGVDDIIGKSRTGRQGGISISFGCEAKNDISVSIHDVKIIHKCQKG